MYSRWMNKSLRALGSLFGFLVALGAFLPGMSRSTPSTKLPKGVEDFINGSESVSEQDRTKFYQARTAQMNGDTTQAVAPH